MGEHRSYWNLMKTYFRTKNINPLNLIYQNRAVCGYHLGLLDTQLWTSAIDLLLDLYKQGKIKPQIDTVWSFDDVSIRYLTISLAIIWWLLSVSICLCVTAAVSDKHAAYLFLVWVPAHHSAPSSAALAEGSRVDCIQTGSPRVQVSTRVCTCIPYWRAFNFVRLQTSRLVSDSVPVPPHHWLSAAPDSLLSVTELSRSPLHVSGTVCQILSLLHLP